MSHRPQSAKQEISSGSCHLPRTKARTAMTAPIRMEILPHRRVEVFFMTVATFRIFLEKAKKEALYP